MMTRRSLLFSSLALAAVSAAPQLRARAQTHVIKKPETVVRAVAVYEWVGEEEKPKASRLIPVTLYIDGHLEDAGIYLARPIPMALDTGTVFELQDAGVPEGTLELSFARHVQAAGSQFDDGWMGFGPYKPLPKPALVAEKKSGTLSKIEVSGGKGHSGPKFSNKSDADKSDAGATSDKTDRPAMSRRTGTEASGADASGTPDDPDRPAMTRRSDTGASPSTDATQNGSGGTASRGSKPDPTSAADPNSEAERPTLRKRTEAQRQAARKEHDTASVTGVGSLNDDPDRPSLHRGKPAGSMDEEDLPALVGVPPDLQQRVAISDAATRAEHNFARPWTDAVERASILGKMQALAKEELAAYDKRNAAAGALVAAQEPHSGQPGSRTRKATGKPPASVQPVGLNAEVLRAYTLSYGGAPTYFYSARSTGWDGVARFISLVAQEELSSYSGGELKIALASVTDERHLDRTPEFRLVDAVDAEASNRASLLMELRAQNSRQFALYRVIGAQAQQTFVSGSTN